MRGDRRFNEAAGFTQRKRVGIGGAIIVCGCASMRPPVLPSGNPSLTAPVHVPVLRFNEAAGFTQRKRELRSVTEAKKLPPLQ